MLSLVLYSMLEMRINSEGLHAQEAHSGFKEDLRKEKELFYMSWWRTLPLDAQTFLHRKKGPDPGVPIVLWPAIGQWLECSDGGAELLRHGTGLPEC